MANIVTSPRYSRWRRPLTDEFVVIDTVPEPDVITDAPSLVRLPDGQLLCACPRLVSGADSPRVTRQRLGPDTLSVYASADEGSSWKEIHRLPFLAGRLFLRGGSVFYLGVGPERSGIWITRSDDGGEGWTEPARLFEGLFYAAASGMAEKDGRLYWAFGAANTAGEFNRKGSRLLAVAGDPSRDLTSPAAWRRSGDLAYPGTPAELVRPGRARDKDHWLEPNVVDTGDGLRVIARLRLDGYTTPGMAAVCDLADDGKTPGPDVRAVPSHAGRAEPLPHHPRRADPTVLDGEQPADAGPRIRVGCGVAKQPGFRGTPGNERRFLMLSYGVDALNWFPAGCVAQWPSPAQAFNYTTPLIDGQDLLIVSRTSRNGRDQHDNDLITFHRLPDFRSLALNLFPGP